MSSQFLKPNFQIICRTCLSESSDLKSLFVPQDCLEEQTLGDLLMTFAAIQVSEDDGLPEGVCLNCLQKLHNAISFRKLCKSSDETLRLWLTPQKRNENAEFSVCNDHQEKKSEECILNNFASFNISNESKVSQESRFNTVEQEFANVFEAAGVENYSNSNSEHEQVYNIEESNSFNSVEQNESFNCIQCNESFASLQLYQKHMTSIHVTAYTCEICGKIFKAETFLKRHIAEHNPKKQKEPNKRIKSIKQTQRLPRTCTICNKTFRFHSNLERHKVIHTGEKPFLCNVCGKSFTQLSYLKIHSFIHTGEKPYKCQMCEKSFGAPGTLMTHIRTHTGERPHICKICGKDFPQSGYLSAHIRTHTGEKPVECKVCHRRFNQRGRLTVHMRMHSGEKPYSCRECGRSFAVKGTLKKHIRTHTGERPYVCSICGQSFTQSGTLATHMKVHRPKLL